MRQFQFLAAIEVMKAISNARGYTTCPLKALFKAALTDFQRIVTTILYQQKKSKYFVEMLQNL